MELLNQISLRSSPTSTACRKMWSGYQFPSGLNKQHINAGIQDCSAGTKTTTGEATSDESWPAQAKMDEPLGKQCWWDLGSAAHSAISSNIKQRPEIFGHLKKATVLRSQTGLPRINFCLITFSRLRWIWTHNFSLRKQPLNPPYHGSSGI